MKKVFMLVTLVVAMAACRPDSNKRTAETTKTASESPVMVEDFSEVFEGTLPSADGKGIDYILTLNAEIQGKDTIFSLDMVYLDANGNGKHMTFNTKGKQQKVHKTVKKSPKTAVKLSPSNGDTPIYFLVVNDTTLRLVDGNLQENVSELNYDIVRVK
ncbi:MAG: copper resistance protein NlpE N-terminal domain-containing protein [Bacteroidaceae bacterium]|nr:copper resistance protein NlpE N-terminal domain-containing protein [Bacteroidaceae bacterium]